MSNYFEIDLLTIQPSQLYISKKKLKIVQEKILLKNIQSIGIIPIKKLDDNIIFTDGHTRAFAAFLAGFNSIYCEMETEELDWEMYKECIRWCKDDGIFTIADLKDRVVEHEDYEQLWYKRCELMQSEIIAKREGLIKKQ
ncbi:MAG: hypothetical protein JXA54_13290 [Candidatus Heimdallarchaeota archaeon]|nr:hypothetical protein [Candidatus Heimdallarchaeota archaeon]